MRDEGNRGSWAGLRSGLWGCILSRMYLVLVPPPATHFACLIPKPPENVQKNHGTKEGRRDGPMQGLSIVPMTF